MNILNPTIITSAILVCHLHAQTKPRTPKPTPRTSDIYAMQAEERSRFVHANIANSISALRQVDAHLRKLPKTELAKLRKTVRQSIAECPYTHATFYLLDAARTSVASFPKSAKPKAPRAPRDRRLASVREAFELQWRVCEQLGVPAALASIEVANIFAKVKPAPGQDDALIAVDSGLARAARLLSTVKRRVDALSAEKKKGIFGRHDTLGPATAGLWNFKGIMIRCANELGVVEGKPNAAWVKLALDKLTTQARALRLTLQRHFALYC